MTMKINEKNLCAFAVSSAVAADREGFLMKKGEVNKGFQKRWFVLKGNLLFYFEKRTDREPLGVIILEGCTVELDENDAQFSFKIEFHGMGNRTYVLCADSQDCMEQWMKSLACASYDYMKLMVTELQRQLKETREKEKKPLEDKTSINPTVAENCDTSASFFLPDDDNYEINRSKSASHLTPTLSPHPPPRHRQSNHNKMTNSQSQSNYVASKLKSGNNTGFSAQANTTLTYGNLRNKVSFKDVHTGFGRPVLRDRNVWRYERKSENSLESDANTTESRGVTLEQNLLISL